MGEGMSKGPWVGVDLDGTLAFYDGWKGIDHVGEPIPAMVNRVREWLARGIKVKVFTARIAVSNQVQRAQVELAIRQWTLKHIGFDLEVTNVKDFDMVELWDDRAVQVEANTGRLIGTSTRGL